MTGRPESDTESWEAFVRAHEWIDAVSDEQPRHISDQAIVSGEL